MNKPIIPQRLSPMNMVSRVANGFNPILADNSFGSTICLTTMITMYKIVS